MAAERLTWRMLGKDFKMIAVLLAVILILLTPISWLPFVLPVITLAVYYQGRARAKELQPIVSAMLDFLDEQEILSMMKKASKLPKSSMAQVRLTEVLYLQLKQGRSKKSCLDGHALGCTHRRVSENPNWPELVKEAVRHGQDG